MVMSREMKEEARREWRELGFYCTYDEVARRWLFVGSRSGLAKLCRVLTNYSSDPKHERISEHEHLGPYQDLKLVTWHAPEIREDGLYGRPVDFVRLAGALGDASRSGVSPSLLGSVFLQGKDAGSEIEVRVAADDFDPAAEDANID